MARGICLSFLIGALLASAGRLPAQQGVMRTDSAGLQVVLNSGEDRPLPWTLESVFSLGGADSGAESFFQVAKEGLAVGASGRVHILDTGNRCVHIFDSAGVHETTFGREGEGPGEFQLPVTLTLAPDGGIQVYDVRRRSLLRFDQEGVFSTEVRGPTGFLGGIARAYGDTLLYSYRSTNRETRARQFHLTFATLTSTTDLISIPLPNAENILYEDCGINISLPPLFAGDPQWDSRNQITAVSEPPEYSLRVFRANREIMRVRRDIEPEEATRDRVIEYLGEGETWTIGGSRECTVPPSTVIEKRGMASHIPVIADVAVSPKGWIWVRRSTLKANSGPIDIFDDRGEYQGTLPGDTPWPAYLGEDQRVLSLQHDEFDIQYVVLYRIKTG